MPDTTLFVAEMVKQIHLKEAQVAAQAATRKQREQLQHNLSYTTGKPDRCGFNDQRKRKAKRPAWRK